MSCMQTGFLPTEQTPCMRLVRGRNLPVAGSKSLGRRKRESEYVSMPRMSTTYSPVTQSVSTTREHQPRGVCDVMERHDDGIICPRGSIRLNQSVATIANRSNSALTASCLEECQRAHRCTHAAVTSFKSCQHFDNRSAACRATGTASPLVAVWYKRTAAAPCPSRQAPTTAPPPSPSPSRLSRGVPSRVAVVYRGAYFRDYSNERLVTWGGEPLCSDYFASADNHRRKVFAPLERAGAQPFVFFHTYASGCRARDDALVEDLKPVAHLFTPPGSLSRVVDSGLVALQLLTSSGVDVDAAILTRFDLLHLDPVAELPVDWSLVNFAWRSNIKGIPRASTPDLFYTIPARHIDAFARSLHSSAAFASAHCTTRLGPRVCSSGHWSWAYLAAEIGNESMAVIDQRFLTYTPGTVCEGELLLGNATRRSHQRGPVFLQLLRHCPGNCSTWTRAPVPCGDRHRNGTLQNQTRNWRKLYWVGDRP